jgi:ubiquilin
MSSQNASGSSLQATGTITVKIQTTGGGGSSCSVTVDSSKTVAAFKEQIKDQCACPPEQQRLIYRGRILKDHETLTSCGT